MRSGRRGYSRGVEGIIYHPSEAREAGKKGV